MDSFVGSSDSTELALELFAAGKPCRADDFLVEAAPAAQELKILLTTTLDNAWNHVEILK